MSHLHSVWLQVCSCQNNSSHPTSNYHQEADVIAFFPSWQSKWTEHQSNPPSDCSLKWSAFQWSHASGNNLILRTIQTCIVGRAQCSVESTWSKLFWFWHRVSLWNRAERLVTWSYIKSEVSDEILDKTNFIVMAQTREISHQLKMNFQIRFKEVICCAFSLWNSCKCYCNFRPSMSIPVGLFQSELPRRHWANYKLFTPSPHITRRGWVLYLRVKIKPAWTRPLTHSDTLLRCPHPLQHTR